MKILLLGKNGQVGWELQRSLAPLGEVIALDRHSTDWCGDITRIDDLRETIRGLAPQIIVNAAAHTAVDKAESEHVLAHTLNAEAPGAMAEEAARLGAWLVHYSTDYVFDGGGDRPWVEDDRVGPLGVYGATKLEGEKRIQAVGDKHLVFRTSWVYAARGANFAKTMLRLAGERDRLSVINDQHGAPTGAELIADTTAHALRYVQKQPSASGLYHLSASGSTTWNDYARLVLEIAAGKGIVLKAQANTVDSVPTSSFPTPARRPLNSRLNTTKLQNTFNLVMPDWRQGVKRMLDEIL